MWLKIVLVSGLLWIGVVVTVSAAEPRKLPALPSPEFRVAEVFDNRLEMWIELYATKDPNVVDYATARKVLRVIMQIDGTPAYEDRKSTRLNSSHGYISYAVFCLKKKNNESDVAERRTFYGGTY